MSDYEDDERPQIKALDDCLTNVSGPFIDDINERFINEALYTLEENRRLDYHIDYETAILIWKIVEANHVWDNVAIERLIEKIRM